MAFGLEVHLQMRTKSSGETGFLYLGQSASTSKTNYAVKVPYPDAGKNPFTTSRLVDSARNAQGTLVGRMVGRSMDKQEMSWSWIDCESWWRLNRWFEENHFTFYCHYFNFNTGLWMTRLMYLSDVKVSPGLVTRTGDALYLRDASFSVIDCGVV